VAQADRSVGLSAAAIAVQSVAIGRRTARRDTAQAMSQQRGDYSPGEWEHPEIEFVIADGPTPGSWTGRGPSSTSVTARGLHE